VLHAAGDRILDESVAEIAALLCKNPVDVN